jgi:hypothetical protein
MRLHANSRWLLRLRLLFVIAAAGLACDSDPGNTPDAAAGWARGSDSLTSQRTELVSDLQKRILFLLSTSPNAPTAGVYMGAPGDTTLSISITNDTSHIAPRLVLENPPLVSELRRVGYRAVSFREAGGRIVVLPLPDPAGAKVLTAAPEGRSGEIARREFADSVAARLRNVGVDARARGAEREILYMEGLTGSADVALGYANAVSGGMLAMERLKALRFRRLIVAGPQRVWCWNLTELSGPVACKGDEIVSPQSTR